jgi:hypothetical protein
MEAAYHTLNNMCVVFNVTKVAPVRAGDEDDKLERRGALRERRTVTANTRRSEQRSSASGGENRAALLYRSGASGWSADLIRSWKMGGVTSGISRVMNAASVVHTINNAMNG